MNHKLSEIPLEDLELFDAETLARYLQSTLKALKVARKHFSELPYPVRMAVERAEKEVEGE